eukprot:c35869_g1_i1 orf=5-208(-)
MIKEIGVNLFSHFDHFIREILWMKSVNCTLHAFPLEAKCGIKREHFYHESLYLMSSIRGKSRQSAKP